MEDLEGFVRSGSTDLAESWRIHIAHAQGYATTVPTGAMLSDPADTTRRSKSGLMFRILALPPLNRI